MLDKRKFLFLLKFFRDSRKLYLNNKGYVSILSDGVNYSDFAKFIVRHWSVISIIFIFLRIIKIPETSPSFTDGVDNKTADICNNIVEIGKILEKEDFIEITSFADSSEQKIKIKYLGEKFIQALPFWNKFCVEYKPLELTLTGGIGGIIIAFLIQWLIK